MPKETTVTHKVPMPQGYGFLRKGNPYLTANVRRKTHAANKSLYVVTERSNNLGLRAPKWILKEVFDEERATREKRQHEVQRRDGANEQHFEEAIRKLFPGIPGEDLQKVTKRALEKRSGRVGRTTLLSIDQRAKLAVAAHVRHCHTQYDGLVRGPMSREEARDAIKGDLARTLSKWGGPQQPQPASQPRRQRKMKARKSRKPKTSKLSPPPPTKPPPKPKPLQEAPKRQKSGRGHVAQRPLPQRPARRGPTRASARLSRHDGDDELEMLSDFPDDEDEPESSGSGAEGAEFDPDGLYEDSLDESEDESEEDSDDDFATEWRSD